MNKKGQAFTPANFLAGLLAVSFVVFILYLWYGKYFDVQTIVKENEFERKEITLAQILLSSDKLAYVDENKVIHRAVLDKTKLDNIEKDSKSLFSEIGYPDSEYYVEIRDLVNDKEWKIGKEGLVLRDFPVAIRYSFDEVHTGMMYITLSSELIYT